MNTKLSNALANIQANATSDALTSGYIRIYNGTQPATADTAVTSQTLLAELRFGATAFGNAADGVITANAITRDDSAAAGGTATWCRILEDDGTTVAFDGDVGEVGSGANLELASTTIVAGAPVEVSTFTYTVTKSA